MLKLEELKPYLTGNLLAKEGNRPYKPFLLNLENSKSHQLPKKALLLSGTSRSSVLTLANTNKRLKKATGLPT